MKIAFIISGLSTGGAETMLHKLMQYIDLSRFDLCVVSLTTKGEIGPHIEAMGIPVHALGMKPGMPNPIKFMRLVRLLLFFRPDVVQTWMYHADLLGGLAARVAGYQHVVWGLRNSNLDAKLTKRSTLLVVKISSFISTWVPKKILTCSTRAAKVHTAVGYRADKMYMIPNGFDLSRFRPDTLARDDVRAELGLAPGTPTVGLVARDDPQKNHSGFIEAAALVHVALPQVHFVLVGTGIDRNNEALTALIKEASLTDYIHLLGRRDDIPRLMTSFDLLVSSSFGEAFPNVLGEAMACGVPCVVTDVGDSAEIVGNTGRVVASGDMNGLAQHIVELLRWPTDQRIQLGIKARQRVRDNYEIGDIAQRYEDFYVQMKGDC